MKQQAGFTILELSVVLALMALMAGVVTVSMNGRLRGAHEDQALEAVRALDHRARHEARTGIGDVVMKIDVRAGKIQVEAQRQNERIVVDAYTLPGGIQMEGAWVLLNNRRVEHKTLSIPIASDGSSPTYGFTVLGQDDDGDTTSTALLVAGVSGQFTVFDDEDDVLEILAQVTGHDAD